MKASLADQVELRELNHRYHDGILVQLLWDSELKQVYLRIEDHKTGSQPLFFPVRDDEAKDAFAHPFIYAGRRVAERVVA
jgi:hypothetical protein